MKRYETYKDSGIQGVGEIPSHWDSNKLKFFADISTGTTPSTANEEYWNEATENWYTPADFNEGDIHLNGSSRKVSAMAFEKSACKVFKKNVVLVVGIGATLGKIGFSRVECSANQQINAIEFYDNVYPLFGAYYLSSLKEVMKSLASAATLAIMNQSVTGSIPFVCPTLTEQETIAAYLDRKVGQIDATIAEKEQMLEDLKNYRSAIISEAVTKGLDKNIEMKDSGVEWIGIIPKTWKIVRIKHILDYKTDSLRVGPFGSSLSGNDFKTEGYWVYNQRVVLDNNFNSNDTFVSQEKYKELSSFKVFAGDILLTTRGTIGKVAIVPNTFHEGVLHPCLIRFRVDDSIVNKDFLAYYFNDTNLILDQVKYNSNSTTIDVIYSYTLKELIVSLPPLDVQNDIVAHLNYKVQKIDEMLKEASQSVENLKSYKSTLITEAVTGKIDLRDWKPKEEKV